MAVHPSLTAYFRPRINNHRRLQISMAQLELYSSRECTQSSHAKSPSQSSWRLCPCLASVSSSSSSNTLRFSSWLSLSASSFKSGCFAARVGGSTLRTSSWHPYSPFANPTLWALSRQPQGWLRATPSCWWLRWWHSQWWLGARSMPYIQNKTIQHHQHSLLSSPSSCSACLWC